MVRQKRDSNIAMLLVAIVVVFAVCNTLRVIINMFEVTKCLIKQVFTPTSTKVIQLAMYGFESFILPWPDW